MQRPGSPRAGRGQRGGHPDAVQDEAIDGVPGRVDTRDVDVHHGSMTGRVKRTYNLDQSTVHRVRELAGLPDTAASQDGVVDLAVERLYLDVQARREADAWETAASDPAFVSEMTGIASDYRDGETWPA